MTPPRFLQAGETYFVTVECVNRSFRLVPTQQVRELLEFALSEVERKYEGRLSVHEDSFLSNHYHLLLTDETKCLPDFMRDLNMLLSRNLNALRGTSGANFEKGYGIQKLLTEEEILEKAIYTLAQPIEANLVERMEDWRGVSSWDLEYGGAREVERPKHGIWSEQKAHADRRESQRSGRAVYAVRSKLNPTARRRVKRPRIYGDLSDAQLRALIRDGVRAKEAEMRAERKAKRAKVVGWLKVVRRHFLSLGKPREMFARNPHVSGGDAETRVKALQVYKAFLKAYREAVERFRAGEWGAAFPEGTWLMERRYSVALCPLPET